MKITFTVHEVDGLKIFYSHEGMHVASAKDCVAFFGEDVNHNSMQRLFNNHQSACAWLQKKCKETYGATDFEEVSSRIVLGDPSALSKARH